MFNHFSDQVWMYELLGQDARNKIDTVVKTL